MLETVIRDLLGSRWEFNPTNGHNVELLADKNGYTDDTIYTIIVVDARLPLAIYNKLLKL